MQFNHTNHNLSLEQDSQSLPHSDCLGSLRVSIGCRYWFGCLVPSLMAQRPITIYRWSTTYRSEPRPTAWAGS